MATTTKTSNEITLTPRSMIDYLANIAIPQRAPVLLVGQPGVGKTDIGHEVARLTNHKMIVRTPIVEEPVDVKGLPNFVKTGDNGESATISEWIIFRDLHQLVTATEPTICMIEDLITAPLATQNAYLQIVLAREINGQSISDMVTFIATTNRRQDRAGGMAISEPLKSRFRIMHLAPSLADFTAWAIRQEIGLDLIAWVQMNWKEVDDWQPNPDIVNGVTPRTLAACGRDMDVIDAQADAGKTVNKDLELATYAANLGRTAALSLSTFRGLRNDLPDLDEIFRDPSSFRKPDNTAALYMVASALARRANQENAEPLFKLVDVLPREFGVFTMRAAIARSVELCETKAFVDWSTRAKNAALFTGARSTI